MNSWRVGVLVGVISSIGHVLLAGEAGVRPIGAYPFLFPEVSEKAKVLLWCDGASLLGVVVADDNAAAPTALLLRDGRCEREDQAVSFGFIVTHKGWVGEPLPHVPQEPIHRVLHRFEGSLRSGKLKGVLVQVNVNHPGQAFQRYRVEVAALPEAQSSFADEDEWRSSMERRFSVMPGDL